MGRYSFKRSWDGNAKARQYSEPDFLGYDLEDPRYAPKPDKWHVGDFGTRQQYVPSSGLCYKDWECAYPDISVNPHTKCGTNCIWFLVGLHWIPHGNTPLGSYRECWSYCALENDLWPPQLRW